MAQPLALITGATKGIGLAFARKFAKNGYALALVARCRDELDTLADQLGSDYDVPVVTMARDLAEPGTALSIEAALSTSEYPLSVVVNNAGHGLHGCLSDLDTDEQTALIQTHVVAVFRLTRLLLPILIEKKGEGIINVASVSAFVPGPYTAVYSASKAFVLSFSEALYEELQDTGIKVTCLAPGPTDTQFVLRQQLQNTWLNRLGMKSPEAVAHAAYKGFKAGQNLVIPGVRFQILTALVGLLPRALVRKIMHYLQG